MVNLRRLLAMRRHVWMRHRHRDQSRGCLVNVLGVCVHIVIIDRGEFRARLTWVNFPPDASDAPSR